MLYLHESVIRRSFLWCHEDHIAAKGINSLSHYNLVRMFVPMFPEKKNEKQKLQWKKNGILEKIPA